MNLHLRARDWIAASVGAIVVAALVGGLAMAAPGQGATRSKKNTPSASRAATTSFHFDNIPVRSALQLIAEEGRFNLVVSDAVQGNISLRLNDVTWEQALQIVLRMKGLQQRVDGRTRAVTAAGE